MISGSVAGRIAQFNQGRRPDTLLLKYAKLRKNAFFFFRGTAHLFYQYASPPAVVSGAPLTRITGDLHLENFGAYIGDDGLACFSVNDFDEAVLAPVAWDLVRFVASLFVGLTVLNRSSDEAESLADEFLQDYARTLAAGGLRMVDAATVPGPIGQIMRAFPSRSTPGFIDERTDQTPSGRKLILDQKRFLRIADAERIAVVQLVENFARQHPAAASLRVLDVARLVAGTSSLGLDRYAVLTEGQAGANDLLELKEVRGSCALPYLNCRQPGWPSEAARVVAAQRLFQDVPPALFGFAGTANRSLIVREYSRARDRLNVTDPGVTEHRLAPTIRTMAQVTANGHLRGSTAEGASGAGALQAFAKEKAWKADLIDYARHCAAASQADYREYSAAFDRGDLSRFPP
jgi:uncharacterized protein (DUF2252 family)